MSAHMEQLIAEFEKFGARIRQAEARFAGVSDLGERVAEVESVATSPDRGVTVVAGAGGMVTDIRLAPEALRLGSAELSATIMATLRQAVAGAARQQAGIVDEAFGGAFNVDASEHVRQAQAAAFGTWEGDLASQDETSSRRPPDASGDDDFDQDTIFGR
ncbi:YbaB/EbfC family nucleoid-associated protein [Actinophytocola gossypii]|uniref:YbaB/EbfC family nucleoid-associated protein n=1 Tax=Actinophytocola gossypii TaxID=2812003 RepID=A0ABT2J2Y9_9PSEU|nr:YbaB/EbfC family nucleoid-associated protein [Actinophytocola gossypii]MCT2582224.1 YbaB/EbfC family nucleoid-associated protein [Actinophytocola gossypii]